MTRPGFSLRAFRGDRRGVSAVEFALLAPIMILFYFGMSEFCQAFMAQKRVGQVASTVADLVTQDDVITTSEINDIFTVADVLMRPFPSSGMTQRVTSVTVNSSGSPRVDWSRGRGVSARATNSTVTLPDGMAERGESVIMAEVTYDYISPVAAVLPALTRFNRTYYLRPRRVDRVQFN